MKNVELPVFKGDDPAGWICRAETYFEVHGTLESLKIRLAKISMKGHTIHWFNLWREEEEPTWANLKQ